MRIATVEMRVMVATVKMRVMVATVKMRVMVATVKTRVMVTMEIQKLTTNLEHALSMFCLAMMVLA